MNSKKLRQFNKRAWEEVRKPLDCRLAPPFLYLTSKDDLLEVVRKRFKREDEDFSIELPTIEGDATLIPSAHLQANFDHDEISFCYGGIFVPSGYSDDHMETKAALVHEQFHNALASEHMLYGAFCSAMNNEFAKNIFVGLSELMSHGFAASVMERMGMPKRDYYRMVARNDANSSGKTLDEAVVTKEMQSVETFMEAIKGLHPIGHADQCFGRFVRICKLSPEEISVCCDFYNHICSRLKDVYRLRNTGKWEKVRPKLV